MKALVSAMLAGASMLGTQDTTTARLPPVVTVTPQSAQSPLDLPFGISVVAPDSLRPGQAHIAADQTLFGIPGVTVANRTNPSQDVRVRSEEHTSELQSRVDISYAVFCLK